MKYVAYIGRMPEEATKILSESVRLVEIKIPNGGGTDEIFVTLRPYIGEVALIIVDGDIERSRLSDIVGMLKGFGVQNVICPLIVNWDQTGQKRLDTMVMVAAWAADYLDLSEGENKPWLPLAKIKEMLGT